MSCRPLLFVAAIVTLVPAALAAQPTADNVPGSSPTGGARTYVWAASTPLGDAAHDSLIVAAVERELAKRQFAVVPAGSTDLSASYHAHVVRRAQVVTHTTGWGANATGAGSAVATTQEVVVMQLAVELRDATRVIWRGAASIDVDPNAPPQAQRRNIDKAVARLLKSVPTAL